MASKGDKKLIGQNKLVIGGVIGLVVVAIGLVLAFGTPSADAVFKGMNEEMLKTKSVTIEQSLKLTEKSGQATTIDSKIFVDMNSTSELKAKGDFSMDINNADTAFVIGGEVIAVGNSNYVKYSELSTSMPNLIESFSITKSKLADEWIKIRDADSFASLAMSPIKFTVNILPTPFANLNDSQRKEIVSMLQDKSMFTIEESSKVDTAGVSAYKYSLQYNKDQYKTMAKKIAEYVDYFETSDESTSEIKDLTVWVNINTKQLIKIEYSGTSDSGDIDGSITFTDYNKAQTVEKPSDYSIESELLN